MVEDLPIMPFSSAAIFDAWLSVHHAQPIGIWLQIAKKGSGVESVTYLEGRDTALCWGWIDGQTRSLDATYYLVRFTPRRPRSKWSKVNRDVVAELIAAGRMQGPGLAQIEAAKADGRWEAAYDSPRTITVPEDLQAALDADPAAAATFATLRKSPRFQILHRIHDAKRPETRTRRIEKFVRALAEGTTSF